MDDYFVHHVYGIYDQFLDWIRCHPEHTILLSSIGNIWTTTNGEFMTMFAGYISEEYETLAKPYLPSEMLYDMMASTFIKKKEDGRYDWLMSYNERFVAIHQDMLLQLITQLKLTVDAQTLRAMLDC